MRFRLTNYISGAILKRSLLTTALAVLLSTILAEPLSVSTSALFSSPEKKDFQMPDLFAQIADNRPVRTLDDRIIIVDICHAERAEIAEGLALLSMCEPKAVGVDINFDRPLDSFSDGLLLESIALNPGIVLPIGLAEDSASGVVINDRPFFSNNPNLDIRYGVTNLPAKSKNGTIREYPVDFQTLKELFHHSRNRWPQ